MKTAAALLRCRNDEGMTRKKKTQNGSRIPALIIAVSAVIACFSLYMIVSTLITGAQEQNAFDALTAVVEQQREQADVPDGKPEQITSPVVTEPTAEADTEPVILPEYAELYEQNNDLFGWLRIDDTPINYPIMHTPDEPQYYLRRAFDKSDAQSGTPFLDGDCFEGCGNYVLYGHHMKNETMFGTLPKYADIEYWEQHKTISFDTLYEHGVYEVIAAFYGKAIAEGDSGFRYYQYTDLTDSAVFAEYMEQVKAAAIYDTGLYAEYGDELITLSTCSYHIADGRFVVVAKKRISNDDFEK